MLLTSCLHKHDDEPLTILWLCIQITDDTPAVNVDHVGGHKIVGLRDNHRANEGGETRGKVVQDIAEGGSIIELNRGLFGLGQSP